MTTLSLHNVVKTEVTTQSAQGTLWTTYKFINDDGTYVEVTAFSKKEQSYDDN